jgi:hypothetical protein
MTPTVTQVTFTRPPGLNPARSSQLPLSRIFGLSVLSKNPRQLRSSSFGVLLGREDRR